MNFRPVFHLISYLLIVMALGMLASWVVGYYYGDPEMVQRHMLHSAGTVLLLSIALSLLTRGPIHLTRRDGFGVVTFGWLLMAHAGALPYLWTGSIGDYPSALFESMSGVTATGSTVLTHIEALPRDILFWRALTQWFGGLGILVLCVAILPFLGVGGMQLYRGEITGPSKDRLSPRIAETAKLLWGVYLLLTILCALFLRWANMSWFDAVCHGLTTVATGGFSTRTASIAAFDSVAVETVMIIFMLLGSLSFALHYRALTGRPLSYFRNPECRFFLGLWLAGCLALSLTLMNNSHVSLSEALRAGFFQCTTLLTTSGFVTRDYDLWPSASRFLLILMMIIGGCAGSTSGGLKAIRLFVLIKKAMRELRLYMRPHAIVQIKLGRRTIESDVISNITSFFVIYFLLWAMGTLLMTFYAPDLWTANASVIATLFNIGPGFGAVGPAQNYADIPDTGKIILTLYMLLGRLELYTVLVLLLPSFWKK